jgi:hypothetical protein
MAKPERLLRAIRFTRCPNDEIGDDAFHSVEQELDWLEMALGEDA